MATLAPTVAATPDYPFQSDQSRPIQEPRADTSKEIALKGIGTAISGGVEIADEYVKSGVRNELHTGLDQINDAAIARLSQARADTSLIDQDEKEGKLPSGLDNLDHHLATLDAARKGNKYSATYIDAQRDKFLQKVRSDFPGYRDYIDETNSKYTREDPANKYITSLIGDINSYKSARDAQHTKVNTEIWRGINNGWDGGTELLAAFESGKLGKNPELHVADWVNKHSTLDYQRKVVLDNVAIAKGNREVQQYGAEDIATKDAASIVSSALDGVYTSTGVKAKDYPMKVLNGEMERMSSADAEKAGDMILQGKEQARLRFMQKANEPLKEYGGRSYAQVVTPTRLKEIWEEQAASFDATAAMYKDQKFGLAYQTHRTTEAIQRDTGNSWATSPDPRIRAIFTNGALAAKYPWMADAIDTAAYAPGMQKAIQQQLMTDTLQAATASPQGAPNKPFTLNEGIDNATAKLQGPEAQAAYAQGALKLTDFITNPNVADAEKIKLAKWAFSPANAGLLDKFAKDSQPDVYEKLYSYGNIKEVHRLGQQDPKLWDDFKTNAYHHFGNNVLHQNIKDLNEIGVNKNLSVHWNSEAHQFSVYKWPGANPRTRREEDNVTEGEFIRAQKSIDNINIGLKTVSGIAKAEKTDGNVAALQFILSAGGDPGSIPRYLLDAMKNSRKPQFPTKDEE